MNRKNLWLLVFFALLPCLLHAIVLHTPFNDYLYSSLCKILLFVSFPLLYFRFTQNGRFKALFSLKGDTKQTKIALFLGLGTILVIGLVFVLLRPFIDGTMVTDSLAHNGITAQNFPLVFIYVVLINAALEELFFRGFAFLT